MVGLAIVLLVAVLPLTGAAASGGAAQRQSGEGPAVGLATPAGKVGDAALRWDDPELVDHTTPFVTKNYLEDVSCVSGPLCVGMDAEGNVVTSTHPGGGAPAWSMAAVDQAPLFSVSCASATLCVAGAEFLQPDGTGTALVSTDPTGGAPAWQPITVAGVQDIVGVSCPTNSLCVGVDPDGYVIVSTDPAGGDAAWNSYLMPGAASDNALVGVSCPSASLCVAVDGSGDLYASSDPAGGASSWHHSATLFGGPSGNGFVNYRGLSCASTTLCVVVGSSSTGTTSMYSSSRPTGGSSSWKASGGGQVVPEAMSCARGPICVAPAFVGQAPGFAVSTNPTQPLSGWSTVTTAGPVSPANAASCVSRAQCVAVDGYGDAVTSTAPTSGPWTVTPVDGSTPLNDVACPSTTSCVAVGDSGVLLTSSTPYSPTSAWAPADVDGTQDLTGVACPSASLCVATDAGGHVLTSSDPAGGPSAWASTTVSSAPLTAVTCLAGPMCVVTDDDGDVMTSNHPGGGRSAWKSVHVVAEGGGGDVPPSFTAVSCTSAPLCVATDADGDVVTSTDPTGSASAWSVSYLGFSSDLTGVSCTGSGSCVATYGSGQMATSSEPTGGRFNWDVTSPVSGTLYGLDAAHCARSGLCVAVGGGELDGPQPDGPWTPNHIDGGAMMTAVDCVGTAMCVAVDAAGRVIVGAPPNSYFSWAGYIVKGPGVTFTEVEGSWVQPAVRCPSSAPSYSSIWVGLDSAKTIEQVGTEADCDGTNQPSYYSWTELYPDFPTEDVLPVKPGDHMTAEVRYAAGTFALTLTDVTTGKHYSTPPVAFSAQRSTAEWIVEDPNAMAGAPLADFGKVGFTGSYATGNGATGSIGDNAWTHQGYDMNTGDGGADVSALAGGGTAFTATWW